LVLSSDSAATAGWAPTGSLKHSVSLSLEVRGALLLGRFGSIEIGIIATSMCWKHAPPTMAWPRRTAMRF